METNYISRDTYGMYKNTEGGPGPALMGADTLIGNDVYNSEDEKLGTIKEFMIDMSSGKISYAVLSFGGFLGVGDRLFAVPWQALQLDTEKKAFTLNVSKDKLKNAPGFDKDHWPSMADRSWVSDGVLMIYNVNYGYVGDWVYRESGETLVFRMWIHALRKPTTPHPCSDTRYPTYPIPGSYR